MSKNVKNNETVVETVVKESKKVAILKLTNDELKELESFHNLLKLDYVTEKNNIELVNCISNSSNDLDTVNKAIKRLNILLEVYKVEDSISVPLLNLISGLKGIKTNIETFKKDATNNIEVLDKANKKDRANYLKLKGFYDWKTPIIKYTDRLYEVKGFTENCKVYLLASSSAKVQIRINLQPFDFKSKKQTEHYNKLYLENEKTVRKAVKEWLGSVTKGYELDSIIQVQEMIARHEYAEKQAKKGAEILEAIKDSDK